MHVLICLTAHSFIFQIDMDSNQPDMPETILMMAKRLNLNTLAEGVETDAKLWAGQRLGCGYAQGCGIGQPIPLDQLQKWAQKYQQKPSLRFSAIKFA